MIHPLGIIVVGTAIILSMVMGTKGLNGAIVTLRTAAIFIG
jgi:hypothetical protein